MSFRALAAPLARTFLACVLISGRINHDLLYEHWRQFRMTASYMVLKQVGETNVTNCVDRRHAKIVSLER